MLTYLRYSLATVCFAASVGCLGMWTWSVSNESTTVLVRYYCPYTTNARGDTSMFVVEIMQGEALYRRHEARFIAGGKWEVELEPQTPEWTVEFRDRLSRVGFFFIAGSWTFFPLWYPALIFVLAGVASLRLGRRFTLRSALIATTVVAGLLGMAVVL